MTRECPIDFPRKPHHAASLFDGLLGFAVCHAKEALVRVVLKISQPIRIVCESIAVRDDLPDQVDGLFVVLAPGPSSWLTPRNHPVGPRPSA